MRIRWNWKDEPGFAVVGLWSRLTLGRLSIVWRHRRDAGGRGAA